jgi:hypothetical protein
MYAMGSTRIIALRLEKNDPLALPTATAFTPATTRAGSHGPQSAEALQILSLPSRMTVQSGNRPCVISTASSMSWASMSS